MNLDLEFLNSDPIFEVEEHHFSSVYSNPRIYFINSGPRLCSLSINIHSMGCRKQLAIKKWWISKKNGIGTMDRSPYAAWRKCDVFTRWNCQASEDKLHAMGCIIKFSVKICENSSSERPNMLWYPVKVHEISEKPHIMAYFS